MMMASSSRTAGSLSGIRVIDLTRVISGPFCTQILGDHGADVVKVESPGRGDVVRGQGNMVNGESWYFAQFNRNKRSLTLDLRNEEGKIVVEDDPSSPNYGFPLTGEPAVIGKVSPDFILGGGSNMTIRNWSLYALFEWKQGGQMYSGSNGLLDYYGLSKVTEDRESTFIYDGVKSDGAVSYTHLTLPTKRIV